MSLWSACAAVAAATTVTMLVNLLTKALDPFVALTAATQPQAGITRWAVNRAGRMALIGGSATGVAVLATEPPSGVSGVLLGMVLGPLAALAIAGVTAKGFVALRRLPLEHRHDLLHATSMAARWPRARVARPPSPVVWSAGPFGSHLLLAMKHRLRSPLLPLRITTWIVAVPVMLVARGALVSRGWDDASAARVLAYVVAAFNLADADTSPVASLEARSIISLHAPKGGRRLIIAGAWGALIPVLGPLLPIFIALGVASGSLAPVLATAAGLIVATWVLAAGSRLVLDPTEDTPAPLDLIAEMLPTNTGRLINLLVAQLVLGAMVWLIPIG